MNSEWTDNLLQKICMGMYQGLWSVTNKLYEAMNGILSSGMTMSRNIISKTPQEWNGEAYSYIETVVNDAVIPIAACFLTFVFCWQIISMVKESNQFHNIKPQNMTLVLITLAVCLIVCARSFDIVNGLFSISKWAVDHMPGGFSADAGTLTELPLPNELDRYGFGDVFGMFGNLVVTLIAELFTYVLVAAIYIRVNIWYLELLIYMAASPMPFSTFMNKEWGQIGMNYLRKMLAMVFEGFFMLLAFGLYQAIASRVLNDFAIGFAIGSDGYLLSMVTTIGCGVALLLIISKAGNISASVFNAH